MSMEEPCAVRFSIRAYTAFGESVAIVGNCAEFANWVPERGLGLLTSRDDFPVWSATATLCTHRAVEYKYVIIRNGRLLRWESFPGNRRVVPVAPEMDVDDGVFGTPLDTSSRISFRGGPRTRSIQPPSQPIQSTQSNPTPSPPANINDRTAPLPPLDIPPSVPASSESPAPESPPSPNGVVPSLFSGPLEGDEIAQKIRDENAKRPSWRRKLDFVRDMFADPLFEPTTANLAYIAAYLHFVNTGEVPCAEEGGHHRPNNHANASKAIDAALAKVSGPDNQFILRKIYPCLPSYSSAYVQATPLTRIRDIAHHKETPRNFKSEIKNTLQNKLHRCAGPEDLVTSADILRRITAPNVKYPDIFVSQFKIFHAELLEFFNASGVDEQLNALISRNEPDSAGVELIRAFLQAKLAGNTGQGDKLITLMRLSSLREHFVDIIGGLGRPVADDIRNLRNSLQPECLQRIRITDIRLEEYAFVILSELINQLGSGGGPKRLDKDSWARAICALGLAVHNIGMAGVDPEECDALYTEVKSFGALDPSVRSELLRLKASVDRSYRLADDFSQRVVTLFTDRAYRLGQLLDVDSHAVRVFCESNIRSHLVFQLSKLLSLVLKEIRIRLQLSPFDALVTGTAVGRLVKVDRLDDLHLRKHQPPSTPRSGQGTGAQGSDKLVAFVDRADGEEEIPRAVVGVILGHELPHLSHLGVRARQEGVVFAVCDDPDTFLALRDSAESLSESGTRIMGSQVMLEVKGDDTVTLKLYGEDGMVNGVNGIGAGRSIQHVSEEPPKVQAAPVDLEFPPSIIPLSEVRPSNAGAKADSARRLADLSKEFKDPLGARFRTPPAVVLPFSAMQEALTARPEIAKELVQMVEEGSGAGISMAELADKAAHIRDLLRKLPVPKSVLEDVAKAFEPGVRVMVRSSANVEDLEKVSGAGLYDSVANVDARDEAALTMAIQTVWSSLWTKRAAVSRRQTGLDHRQIYMAVLIQEMIGADMSFVMMTHNPISGNADEVYVEVAVGMGETLASGVRGTPYRLVCSKATRDVRLLSFATFSFALTPSDAPSGDLAKRRVHYSRERFSQEPQLRTRLGAQLVAIGTFLESKAAFQQPQDIEGLLLKDDIFLVQSRPQKAPSASHLNLLR